MIQFNERRVGVSRKFIMTSLKKNIVYNLLYQVLLIILPLITAPYISRVLGVQGIGTYSYAYSIAYYFGLCGMLGVSNHGNRSVALAKGDKDRLSSTFWNIYAIQFTTTLIALVAFIVYIVFFCSFDKTIAIISILFVISYVLDINWLFFGLEKFKMTVTRNTIIKLCTVICIFFFVKKSSDLWLYVLIMSLGMVFSQVYLWLNVRKFINFVKPQFSKMKKHIKPMLILFIPVIAYSIYKVMDKIMLGSLSSITQVGLYENAEKIINIPVGIITAFGTVMMPRISSLVADKADGKISNYMKQSFKYFSLIAMGMTFGLIGVSSILAPVYFGEEFTDSAPLIAGLSVTLIFMTWANIIRTQYLIPNKKDKPYVISTIAGAVINLCFNLALIPAIGAKGALIGTLLAEFFVFFIQAFLVRKEFNVVKYLKPSIGFCIAGIIMAASAIFIGRCMGESIVTLVVQVCGGAFIYVVITLIILIATKDKDIKNIIQHIKFRFHKK